LNPCSQVMGHTKQSKSLRFTLLSTNFVEDLSYLDSLHFCILWYKGLNMQPLLARNNNRREQQMPLNNLPKINGPNSPNKTGRLHVWINKQKPSVFVYKQHTSDWAQWFTPSILATQEAGNWEDWGLWPAKAKKLWDPISTNKMSVAVGRRVKVQASHSKNMKPISEK
jgi:hypothetical protein